MNLKVGKHWRKERQRIIEWLGVAFESRYSQMSRLFANTGFVFNAGEHRSRCELVSELVLNNAFITVITIQSNLFSVWKVINCRLIIHWVRELIKIHCRRGEEKRRVQRIGETRGFNAFMRSDSITFCARLRLNSSSRGSVSFGNFLNRNSCY